MKHIGVIMEQNNTASLKKLGLLYGSLFLIEVLIGIYQGAEIFYQFDMLMILVLIAMAVILGIHVQRIHWMMSSGSYQRTMLLPIDRRSLLWSEVFYVGASIMYLILIQYLVWILLSVFLRGEACDIFHRFFFYTLNNESLIIMAPYSIYGVMLLLSMIISMSFWLCAVLYSFMLHKYRYLVSVSGLVLFLIMMRCSDLNNSWMLLVLLWGIVIMSYRILGRLLNVRRTRS